MRFYDAHNHLQDPALAPHFPQLLEALGPLGLAGAVVNGTAEDDWDRVDSLAREHSWIIPSYGLHPWRISARSANWQRLLGAKLDGGGAIGEIGLDRWKEGGDFADQEIVFRAQLQMAVERNIPATIHCLRAWGPMWDILRTGPVPARGFLLHAYGGPVEMIAGLASRGAYFSFSGSFLAATREKKREAFREVPPDRLLVETDAPAMPLPPDLDRQPLSPAPDGSPVNHPANIIVAYEGLAELLRMPPESLARIVEENFRRLFLPG